MAYGEVQVPSVPQNAGDAVLRVVDIAVRIVGQEIPRRVVAVAGSGDLVVGRADAKPRGVQGRFPVFEQVILPKGS